MRRVVVEVWLRFSFVFLFFSLSLSPSLNFAYGFHALTQSAQMPREALLDDDEIEVADSVRYRVEALKIFLFVRRNHDYC